jgi:hypothetical protein
MNYHSIFGKIPKLYYSYFLHESCALFALNLYKCMSNDGLNVSIVDLYVDGEYYHTVVEYKNKLIDILGFHTINDVYKNFSKLYGIDKNSQITGCEYGGKKQIQQISNRLLNMYVELGWNAKTILNFIEFVENYTTKIYNSKRFKNALKKLQRKKTVRKKTEKRKNFNMRHKNLF